VIEPNGGDGGAGDRELGKAQGALGPTPGYRLVDLVGQLSGLGGGVFNSGLTGPSSVTLLNTTVASNTANAGGGGIENLQVNGSTAMTVQNTVVSGNGAPGGAGCQNVSGTLTSAGHNLEAHDTCHFAAPGDLPNTDPALGPLVDHRGPTLTMAIPDASPAAEAGDADAALGQRVAQQANRLFVLDAEVVVHDVHHAFPNLLVVGRRDERGVGQRGQGDRLAGRHAP
jgi:hypothetical protein